MMSDRFLHQIDVLHSFTDQLSERLEESRSAAPRHALTPDAGLAVMLDEFGSAVEELNVAEEELRTQNDELAKAAGALEHERRRYQELFEFAPDAYFVTDTNGVIVEANRAVAGLLGFGRKYALKKPLAAFVAEDEYHAFRTRMARLFDAGSGERDRVQEWEVRMRPRRYGMAVEASVRVGAIRDPYGRLTGMRWLYRDITERKHAERQVRTLNAELERRVKERTAQLESVTHINRALLAQEQAARVQAEAALHTHEAALYGVAQDLDRLLRALDESSGTAVALSRLLSRLAAGQFPSPPLRLVPPSTQEDDDESGAHAT